MTDKIKVKPFNSLPFEQRQQIHYYLTKKAILTITQTLLELNGYIGSIPKGRVLEWKNRLNKELDNYEEIEQ